MEGTTCTFLTLTVRKTKYLKSIDWINKCWIKWLKRVQRRLNRKLEWVKIVEMQRSGQPHIHAIVKLPLDAWSIQRVAAWNPHKQQNDWWVREDSWLLKAWQEVINDAKTTKIAVNPIIQSQKSQSQSASELSKYLSKAKSKETKTRNRWYSFSGGYEGCKPKLKQYGSIFDAETNIKPCNREPTCNCERLIIYWKFKHHSNVFINTDLVKSMVKGG